MAEIHGNVDGRFAAMGDVLRANLDSDEDLGASIAVMHEGELVVDAWGGFADPEKTKPWEADTITNVWSTTKTMTSLCALMLVDQGELDVNRKVADYWPEFAANGKADIEVRHLMSHTSGLSGWEEPLTPEDVLDWEKSTSLLAAQAPWWEPGTVSGYHALTQGHLVGEVVRRVSGQSLGTFFKNEVADPLDADFHIGLDPSNFGRVSNVVPPSGSPLAQTDEPPAMDSVLMKTFINPVIDAAWSWSDEWRQAEVPAANGHGNARAVATIQGILANGGEMNGKRFLKPETIDLIFDEQSNGDDLVLSVPIRFGMGYGLPTEMLPFLPVDQRICFWGGWGGSLIIIDVDRHLAVSYMMNRMGDGLVGDLRGAQIVMAAFEAIA